MGVWDDNKEDQEPELFGTLFGVIQEAWYFPAEDLEHQSGPKDLTLSTAAINLGGKKTLLDLAIIFWK